MLTWFLQCLLAIEKRMPMIIDCDLPSGRKLVITTFVIPGAGIPSGFGKRDYERFLMVPEFLQFAFLKMDKRSWAKQYFWSPCTNWLIQINKQKLVGIWV
jgi:hypothetical protein